MSLETLKKDELDRACEFYGVEVAANAGNKAKVAALVENGVTWDLYSQHLLVKDEEEAALEAVVEAEVIDQAVEEEATGVLMFMQRPNPSFDIKGYTFTRENPFVIVSEADADYIVKNASGFRPAVPSEVREWYG